MIWAKKEAPESEKYSHKQVDYVYHSPHIGKHCGNCSMIIHAKSNRCTIVVKPIATEGYCKKWNSDASH